MNSKEFHILLQSHTLNKNNTEQLKLDLQKIYPKAVIEIKLSDKFATPAIDKSKPSSTDVRITTTILTTE
jgi:hypothetical protein